jgi:hypothetical protein
VDEDRARRNYDLRSGYRTLITRRISFWSTDYNRVWIAAASGRPLCWWVLLGEFSVVNRRAPLGVFDWQQRCLCGFVVNTALSTF